MGSEKGKLVICDRCGETVFLKFLERRGGSNYGSDYDVYDELPEDWLFETEIGYLCPKCANEFRKWITHFMNGKVPLKEAYKMVFDDMTSKVDIFTSIYDAKHGSKEFMHGVSMTMEYIAYNVSEETGVNFEDLFVNNLIKCEKEVEND